MKTIFQIWLGLMILSYTIFTPVYFFSNSSKGAVKELTFEELFLKINVENYPSSYEDQLKKLERIAGKYDLDTSYEFLEALEDNKNISDITFKLRESNNGTPLKPYMTNVNNLDLIQVSFNDSKKGKITINLLTQGKGFIPPMLSEVYGPMSIFINGLELGPSQYNMFFLELYFFDKAG